MSRKQINEAALEDELSSSAFFQPRPAPPSPPSTSGPSLKSPAIRESQNPEHTINDELTQPSASGSDDEASLLVGKEGSREIGKEASLEGGRQRTALFDLDEVPYRKDSFLFTSAEFEKFDDVKLDLRRKFDLKATKNDLARCGLGYLLEDYDRRGPDSELVRRLRRRRPR